jgi:hypothetical protein
VGKIICRGWWRKNLPQFVISIVDPGCNGEYKLGIDAGYIKESVPGVLPKVGVAEAHERKILEIV